MAETVTRMILTDDGAAADLAWNPQRPNRVQFGIELSAWSSLALRELAQELVTIACALDAGRVEWRQDRLVREAGLDLGCHCGDRGRLLREVGFVPAGS